jgi:Ca-activated chloride channel homolog
MRDDARVFAGAVLLIGLLAAAPARGAALALVLAIDVSASVTADSYLLQHDGIARAFVDRRLLAEISALPRGLDVLVLEWSDPDKMSVTVDWTRVIDAASAETFAAAVRATRRSSNGLTAIGTALLAAAAAFDRLPEPPARRVIDISGDGMANFGPPPAAARDRIVAAGITINGLAILTGEPWLADYYRHNVIGGPSAFVAVARTYDDFGGAIARKLIEEVADARGRR